MHPADGVIVDALLQAARLADIEHVALGIEHAVDAGTVGKPLDEFADQFRADEPGFIEAARIPVDRRRKRGGGGNVAFHFDIVFALIRLVVENAAIRQLSSVHSVISATSGVCQARCWPPSRAIIWPVIEGVS